MVKKFAKLLIIITMFNAPTLGVDEDKENVRLHISLNKASKPYRGRKEYENWKTYLISWSLDPDTIDQRPHTCGSRTIKFLPYGGALLTGAGWAVISYFFEPSMLYGLIVAIPGGAIAGALTECTLARNFFEPYEEG